MSLKGLNWLRPFIPGKPLSLGDLT